MKRSKKVLRTLSFILLQTFVAQQISYADVLTPLVARQELQSKPEVGLKFSDSVASIEDAYKNGGDKLFYLMQDAHTNESGQYNLAKSLGTILDKEKDLKYVFTEAGYGDDSVSFLKPFRKPEDRDRVARSYIKKGMLHGHEYLNLMSDRDFTIWGVENPELYAAAVENYRQVAKEREHFDMYLKKIEATTETLKNRLLNPSLQNFDRERKAYREEKLALTAYFNALWREANIQNISLASYPHLGLLKTLKEKEEKLDFAKANEEHLKAVQSLSAAAQAELKELTDASQNKADKILGQGQKETQAYFFALEEKLTSRTDYKELSKYFEYLKLAKNVEAREVLKEIDALENAVIGSLARTQNEKDLIRCENILFHLKKLFHFTLTPEEYLSYKEETAGFDIEHLTGFLNKQIMDLGMYYDRSLFLEKGYDEMLRHAESFYELTKTRDEFFLTSALEKMDKESAKKAVLVTGGFHTSNLKALLKAKGISFISITPQVWQATNIKKYESILLSQAVKPVSMPALAKVSTAMTPILVSAGTQGARLVLSDMGGNNSQAIAAIRDRLAAAMRTASVEYTLPDEIGRVFGRAPSNKVVGMDRATVINALREQGDKVSDDAELRVNGNILPAGARLSTGLRATVSYETLSRALNDKLDSVQVNDPSGNPAIMKFTDVDAVIIHPKAWRYEGSYEAGSADMVSKILADISRVGTVTFTPDYQIELAYHNLLQRLDGARMALLNYPRPDADSRVFYVLENADQASQFLNHVLPNEVSVSIAVYSMPSDPDYSEGGASITQHQIRRSGDLIEIQMYDSPWTSLDLEKEYTSGDKIVWNPDGNITLVRRESNAWRNREFKTAAELIALIPQPGQFGTEPASLAGENIFDEAGARLALNRQQMVKKAREFFKDNPNGVVKIANTSGKFESFRDMSTFESELDPFMTRNYYGEDHFSPELNTEKRWPQLFFNKVQHPQFDPAQTKRKKSGARLALTMADLNQASQAFVNEYGTKMMGSPLAAGDFEIIDTEQDFDRLAEEEIAEAEEEARLTGQPQRFGRTANGNFYANSDPDDVARAESATYTASRNPKDKAAKVDDKPSANNWRHTDELKPVVENLIAGSTKGKKLYIIPYLMGPVGSEFSQVGIEITDSRYVALNMMLMAKVGKVALNHLAAQKDSSYFFRGVHSTGDLKALAAERKAGKGDNRYFVTFLDERLGISYGSAYGGNALLGKKVQALRQASYDARKQGWLAEHMAIVEYTNPANGEKTYWLAPFPSASGKTNFAFLDDPNFRIVGDDIAWMRVNEKGELRAINPEDGFFGVTPGTNPHTNRRFFTARSKPNSRVIETNLARNIVTNELFYEGLSDYPTDVENWIDWKREPIANRPADQQKNKKFPWAHPNSRSTVPIANADGLSEHAQDPEGVLVSGFLFGGKLDKRQSLVEEIPTMEAGISEMFHMIVQATAAAEGKEGTVRGDWMAMLPFLSYHQVDYLKHWHKVMSEIEAKGGKVPSFFRVNWFRLDEENGDFLWDGFAENKRVVKWANERIHGQGSYTTTPLGTNVPVYGKDSFGSDMFPDTKGDDAKMERWNKLFRLDLAAELVETERRAEFDKLVQDADHQFPSWVTDLQKVREQKVAELVGARLASQEEVRAIAQKMVTPTAGVLAADESIPSAKNRLDLVKLTNEGDEGYANRQEMRRLMLTVPGQEEAISGVILHEETFDNVDLDGQNLVEKYLIGRGIVPIIKIDKGQIDDAEQAGQKLPNPKGLAELPAMLDKFYDKGARGTKWRTTTLINPSEGESIGAFIKRMEDNIRENARVQAVAARMVQDHGMVPMVEPEVLYEKSSHDLEASSKVTARVFEITFEELNKAGVWLDGMVLKTSMVLAGQLATQTDPETVGRETLKVLLKTVPAEVQSIVFLSGGQKDDQVVANLNGVSRARLDSSVQVPWEVSYSFGRGLQRPGLLVWDGKLEKFVEAQATLLKVARDTRDARLGQLKTGARLATREELNVLAHKMVDVDKGVLAADESTGSAAKRLDMVGLENTYENREAMRQIMLSVEGQEAAISAVILYEETFSNTVTDSNGKAWNIAEYLLSRNILPIIKIDKGLLPANEDGQQLPNPKGLLELQEMLEKFKAQGAVGTKWRTLIDINPREGESIEDFLKRIEPSLRESAKVQAKAARMVQDMGMVPMVEPEVQYEKAGHDVVVAAEVTERVLEIQFEELVKAGVWLDGIILKTSMVLAGQTYPVQTHADIVGFETLTSLLKTVPAEVPAIVFLSGGQKDDQVIENLNGVSLVRLDYFTEARDVAVAALRREGKNKRADDVAELTDAPWEVSYSFGRGLQRPGLITWGGGVGQADDKNIPAAKAELLKVALRTRLARLGRLDEAGARLAFGMDKREFEKQKSRMVPIFISGGEAAGVNDYFSYAAAAIEKQGLIPVMVQDGIDAFTHENLHERVAVITPDIQHSMLGLGGAEAGTSRVNLLKEKPETIELALKNMDGFKSYLAIGGGDHAVFWTTFAAGLAKRADEFDPEILKGLTDTLTRITSRMIVVYKTIDGDVFGQPLGLRTAAENGQRLVYSSAASNAAGTNKSKVTVMGVMGADVGRLAVLSAQREALIPSSRRLSDQALVKQITNFGPQVLILIPEIPVTLKQAVDAVRELKEQEGAATVVVSEGFRIEPTDEYLLELIDPASKHYDAMAASAWDKFVAAAGPQKDPHGNVKWSRAQQEVIVAAALSQFLNPDKATEIRVDGKLSYNAFRGANSGNGYYDRMYAQLLADKVAELIKKDEFGVVVSLPADSASIDREFANHFRNREVDVLSGLQRQRPLQILTFAQVQELKNRFGLYDSLLAWSPRELRFKGVLVPENFDDAPFAEKREALRQALTGARLADTPQHVQGEFLSGKTIADVRDDTTPADLVRSIAATEDDIAATVPLSRRSEVLARVKAYLDASTRSYRTRKLFLNGNPVSSYAELEILLPASDNDERFTIVELIEDPLNDHDEFKITTTQPLTYSEAEVHALVEPFFDAQAPKVPALRYQQHPVASWASLKADLEASGSSRFEVQLTFDKGRLTEVVVIPVGARLAVLADSARPAALVDRTRTATGVKILEEVARKATQAAQAVNRFVIGTAQAQPFVNGQTERIVVRFDENTLFRIGLTLEGNTLRVDSPELFSGIQTIDLADVKKLKNGVEASVSLADLMMLRKQKQLARIMALDGLLRDVDNNIKVVQVIDKALLGELNGPQLSLLAAEAYELSKKDRNFRIQLDVDALENAAALARLTQLETELNLASGVLTDLFQVGGGFEKAMKLYVQSPESPSRQGEGVRNFVLSPENLSGFALDLAVVTARLPENKLSDDRYVSAYSMDMDPSVNIQSAELVSVIMGRADESLRRLYALLPQIRAVDMNSVFSLAEMIIRSVGRAA